MADEHTTELGELTTLARRFAERNRLDEAEQLFELALRLDPHNLGTRLALAQLRRQQRRGASGRDPAQRLREELRRSSLDAKHFFGLAALYAEKGERDLAIEHLRIAVAKDLPNPLPHRLLGELLSEAGDDEGAAPHLRKARRFDPFDRHAAVALGRALRRGGDDAGALAAFVDAFLLLPDGERRSAGELRHVIQELKSALEWDNDRLLDLFHERQDALRLAFDRVELHRELFDQEEAPVVRPHPRADGRLAQAARLRQLELWSHLSDEQVFELSRAASEEELPRGGVLYGRDDAGTDLFQVVSGEVTVRRRTPYGGLPLGLIRSGELFGEVAFLLRGGRSGEAVATRPCRLVRFDERQLRALMAASPALGVQLMWSLWHALAFKLRCTNEQLRTVLSDDLGAERILTARPSLTGPLAAAIDAGDKIRLFQEQGLSGRELLTLATFSRERTYPAGEVIFREGDPGAEMFVVVEGRVMISKFIPGGGDEALAILDRGGFFGEMALIDGHPRSADARAHEGPVTLVTLEEATIRDVLSADPATALPFLELLCSLSAKRLREINGKVIAWRIMAGQTSSHPASA